MSPTATPTSASESRRQALRREARAGGRGSRRRPGSGRAGRRRAGRAASRRRRASSAAGASRASTNAGVGEREPVGPEPRAGATAPPSSATARAAASSTSFQAATTSSAAPRTPASHSSAITRLWSASPTTRTASAIRGQALAHVIATSVRPRLTMRTGAGKEAAQIAASRAGGSRAPSPCRRGRRRGSDGALGQPVHERQPRVHLDREPAVRGRQEHPAADAQRLARRTAAAARRRRRARSPRSRRRCRTPGRRTGARRRRPGT